MNNKNIPRIITSEIIHEYSSYLLEREKSNATIQQYVRDITALSEYMNGREITKPILVEWKDHIVGKRKTSSVNAKLAALNSFLDYTGWADLKVKPVKIQKTFFSDSSKELTREEYERLVRAAQDAGNQRLYLIIQTICSTGIRVSELKFITVEAVETGVANVDNKGKIRRVFLPKDLRRILKKYIKSQGITEGPIFVTKSGKPVDRSNIWRDMKKLCKSAGVNEKKVFPHNLRHLFARTYYSLEKDLSRLADILGHTSVNTTRIYTMESGTVHARQVDRLGLVIT